jgi:hypothetical protein
MVKSWLDGLLYLQKIHRLEKREVCTSQIPVFIKDESLANMH